MRDRQQWAGKFWRDLRGATAIEYALIIALISLAIIATMTALGQTNAGIWMDVSDRFTGATTR